MLKKIDTYFNATLKFAFLTIGGTLIDHFFTVLAYQSSLIHYKDFPERIEKTIELMQRPRTIELYKTNVFYTYLYRLASYGVEFVTFPLLVQTVAKNFKLSENGTQIFSAFSNGMIQSVLNAALAMINIKLNTNAGILIVEDLRHKERLNLFGALKEIVNDNGILGFFIGENSGILLDGIASVCILIIYVYVQKLKISKLQKNNIITVLALLVAYPLGCVRWLLEVDSCRRVRLFKGELDCFLQMYNQYGILFGLGGIEWYWIKGIIGNVWVSIVEAFTEEEELDKVEDAKKVEDAQGKEEKKEEQNTPIPDENKGKNSKKVKKD